MTDTTRSGSMSLLLVALTVSGGWRESAATCRTYPTASTGSVSQPGVQLENISTTCDVYNSKTNQMICTIKQTSSSGSPFPTTVITATYKSVADFVDEVSVVPPLQRPAGVTMSITGGQTSDRRITYDNQGRTTQSVNVTAGTTLTETHTAWDSAGRSTKITVTPPVGATSILSYSYDDAARTQTISNSGISGSMTLTFDVNGNLARSIATYGGVNTTTAHTVTATGRICK